MREDSSTSLPAWPMWWLIALALAWTAPATAQTVALGPCGGGARAQAGQKIVRQLKNSLQGMGVTLLAPEKYMRAAGREKLARRAYSPQAVAKLAPALALDGVVTCTIAPSRGAFAFAFRVLGPDGKTRDEVRLRNRKPVLGRPGITKVAKAVIAALPAGDRASAGDSLEPPDDIALVPLVPIGGDEAAAPPDGALVALRPDGEDEKKTDLKKEGPVGAKVAAEPERETAPGPASESKPASIVAAFKQPAPGGGAVIGSAGRDTDTASGSTGQVTRAAPPKASEPKSVPEVWVAAGASMHLRAGLNPRYQAGPFPGFRVEGRAFLGALVDMAGLEDLGLEFAYDRGIGLTYSSAFRPDKIDAFEQHWRVGLVYRLSFEQVPLGPALLFRVGYGGTANGVDKAYPDIVSADYSHLDLTVDAHVWLVRPLLEAYLSAGWVALVTPGDSLSGSGMGLTFGGGVALELLDALHLSAGYEQWQFVFDEDVMGETSDRFQMLFVRAGWSYR